MISLLVSYLLIQTITAQESNYQCDPTPLGLSDNCIGCICEASTRCDQATQCVGGNSFCGPFLISKSFWTDAGQCVIEGDNSQDPESWRRCSLDIICAANIIRSYINPLYSRLEKMLPGYYLRSKHNQIINPLYSRLEKMLPRYYLHSKHNQILH
ncbi:uncharacterized protein LOC111700169 isoform X2 [Eurytemora carolleeae]|uniref:uncharacterized protein LOC111700169 isoform X2 n=1 Tax=Eurytemora carolleeae TaxID=1294199 RepID=UPI000C756BA8|nr:uncharacterized protein LOC111700169 isoform X2 [Eurytemora carolleeae]|eukprot:XP_023326768.1 uncharacterized protein LOC111700169 isoform X2 [Eurytemora affinis]